MIRLLASFLIIIGSTSCVEKSAQIKTKDVQASTEKFVHTVQNSTASSKTDTSSTKKKKKTVPPPPPVIPYPEYDPILPEPIEPFDPAPPVEAVYAEPWEPNEDTNQVLTFAEQMPEFPGGLQEMNNFIAKHLKYPEIAKEIAVQGRVFVKFTVSKDGSLKDVVVVRGVHNSLDAEAKRVIKLMPKWIPAKHNGKVVNCQMIIPIKFQLD